MLVDRRSVGLRRRDALTRLERAPGEHPVHGAHLRAQPEAKAVIGQLHLAFALGKADRLGDNRRDRVELRGMHEPLGEERLVHASQLQVVRSAAPGAGAARPVRHPHLAVLAARRRRIGARRRELLLKPVVVPRELRVLGAQRRELGILAS